tara:strand:+ start:1287 stop:1697 length:411 start_codon:yes stop_codon:yes gene_type:complete
MLKFFKKLNDSLLNFEALASHLFRFGIGTAFIIHGLNKFPLPPEALIEYFDLSPFLASFVALSELSAGTILVISGFIKSPYGSILTRLAGLTIIIMMINIFAIAHQDWFINTKLFTSEQIFLFIGGLYFFIKGNKL